MHAYFTVLVLGVITLISACADKTTEQAAKARKDRPPHLVETTTVNAGKLEYMTRHNGTVRAGRFVNIHAREEGRLQTLKWSEGDRVDTGEILIRIDDSLLRAEAAKALATRKQAEVDLERLRKLDARQLVSDDKLALARTAVDVARAEEKILHTRLAFTVEKAPFDGIVSQRHAEPGDILARHAHVLTIIDPASMIIEATIPEAIFPNIRVGDAVVVRIDALGGQAMQGTVMVRYPELDPVTRRGTLEIALDESPLTLSPGQFARIELTAVMDKQVHIPFRALRHDRQGEFVYRFENGKVVRNAVESGRKVRDRILIRDGLDAGAEIVTSGFLGLRNGKKVKVSAHGPAVTE